MCYKVNPRELVSEAYLRLRGYDIDTDNRGPFFALMARAMCQYRLDPKVRAFWHQLGLSPERLPH